MNISHPLVGLLVVYGLPVLFLCTAICCFGVPMPGLSLLLVAAGSYAQQAHWSLWQVLLGATSAAVIGDMSGFFLARRFGQQRVLGWAARLGLEAPDGFASQGQAPAIFLTRWLVPLGPWVNFRCGLSAYPWPRFLLWSVVGESLWICLYVIPGYWFRQRVQDFVAVLGNLGVASLALVGVGLLLRRYFRAPRRA